MLEDLALAAAASREVANRPLHELAEIHGWIDQNGVRHPASHSDALIIRNEFIVEARGLDHLSRIIAVRQQILTETINKPESNA